METVSLHLAVGWGAILLGVAAGAAIGLFFHMESWAGGYASYRRRMLRLAHIAFFGLGFLNLFFALTLERIALPPINERVASLGLILGVITMPMACLLAAWRKPMRHFFPVPVIAVSCAILFLLLGWRLP